MKFACDACSAQYMIADEKVGSKGVKVRCKKCSNVIVVKALSETSADPAGGVADSGPSPMDQREDSETQLGFPSEAVGSKIPKVPDPFAAATAGSELEGETASATQGQDATIVLPNPLASDLAPVRVEAAPGGLTDPGSFPPTAGGGALDFGAQLGAELGSEIGQEPASTQNGALGSALGDEASSQDDEIGSAFDNIFGGEGDEGSQQPDAGDDPFSSDVDDAFASALGDAVAEGPDEHASTRVFDTASMKLVADERERGTEEEVLGAAAESGGAALSGQEPADAGEAVWYIALAGERVGPLTSGEIQGHFEAGDAGPDSLCWRKGMVDWMPLSTVEGLKELVAPMPEAFASPRSNAFGEEDPESASDTVASSGVEQSSGQEAADGWQPNASALLQTLASSEIDAMEGEEDELARPTADPVGVPVAEQPLGFGGGALDLSGLPPPPSAVPEQDLPLPPAGVGFQPAPPSRPMAAIPQAPYSQGAFPAQPFASPGPPTGSMAALSPAQQQQIAYATGQVPALGPATGTQHTLPVGPATGHAVSLGVAPRGMELTMGRLVALGGGLIAVLSVLVFGGLWMGGVFDKRPALAETGEVSPVATEAVPPATPPVKVVKVPPAPTPAAVAPSAVVAVVAVAKAAPAASTPSRPNKARSPRKGTKSGRGGRHTRQVRTPPPPPKPQPKPRSRHASKGDDLLGDDFDGLFDDKPAAKSGRRTKPSRGYIPPAPGAAKNLPKSLGQSDIIQVVAQNKGKLKGCADKQKASSPGSGKVVVSWRVRPDGRTASVKCKTQARSVFCGCAKRVVSGMRFPRYGGPPMSSIDFPFSY